jgi:hypothetical protein
MSARFYTPGSSEGATASSKGFSSVSCLAVDGPTDRLISQREQAEEGQYIKKQVCRLVSNLEGHVLT